jgi:hypothetical protein
MVRVMVMFYFSKESFNVSYITIKRLKEISMEIRAIAPRLVAGCLLLCLCGKNPVSTPPTVEFSGTQQTVNKNSGSAAVNIVLSATSNSNVTVPFTVMGGSTANNPADYSISSTSVVIPAGSLNGSISVSLVNNVNYVPSKTLIVGLNTPTNAKLGTRVFDTLIIVDTTTPPTVGFSNPSMTNQVSKQIVNQDTGTLNIQVSLSKAFASNVTVPIIVLNGSTANDPLDYTLGSSPIVIPAGDTTDSISLSIVPHESYQLSKTVLLTLGSPTNAKLGDSILDTVIIVDKNGFGQHYRINDNEVTGWQQNTDTTQDTFSLWVGDELFSHIDGGADLYLNRGCLVSMYQYMVGPNGPDSQVCMVIAMDFSTAAQADSMFRYEKETSTVPIPEYESSVAIAYPGILGNITVYAHFKAIYFELMLSGYIDQDAARLIASQLLKVLELKTH